MTNYFHLSGLVVINKKQTSSPAIEYTDHPTHSACKVVSAFTTFFYLCDRISRYRTEPELSAEVYPGARTSCWGRRPHLIQSLFCMIGKGAKKIYSFLHRFVISCCWLSALCCVSVSTVIVDVLALAWNWSFLNDLVFPSCWLSTRLVCPYAPCVSSSSGLGVFSNSFVCFLLRISSHAVSVPTARLHVVHPHPPMGDYGLYFGPGSRSICLTLRHLSRYGNTFTLESFLNICFLVPFLLVRLFSHAVSVPAPRLHVLRPPVGQRALHARAADREQDEHQHRTHPGHAPQVRLLSASRAYGVASLLRIAHGETDWKVLRKVSVLFLLTLLGLQSI